MFVIERLSSVASVYVTDGKNYRFPFPIPVKCSCSGWEQELVKKISKEKGDLSVTRLMLDISGLIAESGGGEKLEILRQFMKYKKGYRLPDPLIDYEPYTAEYCLDKFEAFKSAVDDGEAAKWDLAAYAHALISRITPTESFDPKKWKTEMAFNGEMMPVSILQQMSNLYYLESRGADLSPYLNSKDEFTWVQAKDDSTKEVETLTEEEEAKKS